MIIVKVLNHRVVQVAFAGQASGQLASSILATKNTKQFAYFARTLVQSTSQNQKVTNANNQQHLIPIARNISFRQCRAGDQNRNTKTNSQVSFSISAASPTDAAEQYFTADNLDQATSISLEEERESSLVALKRKAKDVVEKRELSLKGKYYGQSFNETLSSTADTGRRLVVLMSWLEAKEKHIEKYRQFYLDRGFDVLNVKTSPLDLLLPNVGTNKISKDFVRFMMEKQYSNVVLHGFSVGGFMFGQILLAIDRQEPEVRQELLKSIHGIVFDSLVPLEGIYEGVSKSLTTNPIIAKLLENMIRVYLVVGRNIATKYYEEASEKVWGGPLNCPSLFLMSKDDRISDHRIVKRLIKAWSDKGIECHEKLWESSPHVQLFTKHHSDYVEQVEKFLKHIKLSDK